MDAMKGTKWDARFLKMAQEVATWSSCYQDNRQVGAVIAKNKRILTTGYNGASSGIVSCKDRGECIRRKLGIASGTKHEICYATHAEQNAIIQAARMGVSIDGATLYCTHQPCVICAKMIINSGIVRIVYKSGYPDEFAMQLLHEAGVEIEQMDV
ncbi:MAG: deoxycytidylate deaminase [Christensenellales bacterium]